MYAHSIGLRSTTASEALTYEPKSSITSLRITRASVSTASGTALTADFRLRHKWRLTIAAVVRAARFVLEFSGPVLHGDVPRTIFQSLHHIDAWDDSGVDVQTHRRRARRFLHRGGTPQLILNPVLLDALGQVVACWLVQFYGTGSTTFHRPSIASTLDTIARRAHIQASMRSMVDGKLLNSYRELHEPGRRRPDPQGIEQYRVENQLAVWPPSVKKSASPPSVSWTSSRCHPRHRCGASSGKSVRGTSRGVQVRRIQNTKRAARTTAAFRERIVAQSETLAVRAVPLAVLTLAR